MKKIAISFIFGASVLAFNVQADPFNSSSQTAQLAALVANAKEQLLELHKQLSVMEQLQELARMDAIRDLSDTGEHIIQMYSDISEMERTLIEWTDDPLGTKQIERDLERMKRLYQNTEGARALDKMGMYGDMLTSLNRMKWLGKTAKKAEDKERRGLTPKQAARMGASADITTSSAIIDAHGTQLRREIIGSEIFIDTFMSLDYGNVGLMK